MRIHPVFHASLLTPYHANTLPGRTQPLPPPLIVEGVEEFEVKEILDSRIRYNKLEYFVDWKGYPPNDRTWEPPKSLENASDSIARFHTRYPNRPSPKDLPPRRRTTAAQSPVAQSPAATRRTTLASPTVVTSPAAGQPTLCRSSHSLFVQY
jgi:hypothetical protein